MGSLREYPRAPALCPAKPGFAFPEFSGWAVPGRGSLSRSSRALVVEILSPATGQKDFTTKRWLYEAAGVPEYLIVYPEERRAERLTLGPDCIYQTTARTEWGSRLTLLGGKVSVVLG